MILHLLPFETEHEYSKIRIGIEVPVNLSCGPKSVRLMAKVDTGATYCIFQREYAEEIGIDVSTGRFERFTTATGFFATFGHEVKLDCLGITSATTVYFAAEWGFPRNVLGRVGWLNLHRIAIIDHDSLLYVSHYNDRA